MALIPAFTCHQHDRMEHEREATVVRILDCTLRHPGDGSGEGGSEERPTIPLREAHQLG